MQHARVTTYFTLQILILRQEWLKWLYRTWARRCGTQPPGYHRKQLEATVNLVKIDTILFNKIEFFLMAVSLLHIQDTLPVNQRSKMEVLDSMLFFMFILELGHL